MTRPARSSGAPSVAPSGDAATPAAQMTVAAANGVRANLHAPAGDVGHCRTGPHAHAETHEIGARRLAQRLRKRAEHVWTRLEQDDAGRAGIEVPEVPGERLTGDLGQRAGHLDACRAAANHDECQQRLAANRVGLALGVLERQQHATADVERVLDRLESGRDRAPLVMPEVGVRRATRDDQIVVGELTVGQHELPAGLVDGAHLREEDLHVQLAAQNPSDGRRDVPRRERRHRHLIEQRLEDVMVAPVDDRDADAGTTQGAGRIQPAKPAADDDDMGKRHEGGFMVLRRRSKVAPERSRGGVAEGVAERTKATGSTRRTEDERRRTKKTMGAHRIAVRLLVPRAARQDGWVKTASR